MVDFHNPAGHLPIPVGDVRALRFSLEGIMTKSIAQTPVKLSACGSQMWRAVKEDLRMLEVFLTNPENFTGHRDKQEAWMVQRAILAGNSNVIHADQMFGVMPVNTRFLAERITVRTSSKGVKQTCSSDRRIRILDIEHINPLTGKVVEFYAIVKDGKILRRTGNRNLGLLYLELHETKWCRTHSSGYATD